MRVIKATANPSKDLPAATPRTSKIIRALLSLPLHVIRHENEPASMNHRQPCLVVPVGRVLPAPVVLRRASAEALDKQVVFRPDAEEPVDQRAASLSTQLIVIGHVLLAKRDVQLPLAPLQVEAAAHLEGREALPGEIAGDVRNQLQRLLLAPEALDPADLAGSADDLRVFGALFLAGFPAFQVD
ncbi:uncharacterized protein DSM5745_09816 [Aspergillus mulundensis]|uniref:Uncharacterized protein n=1 Tax=Aspergillus mulundensis TaxID=1810919 RepID=A0A3D8QRH6_9EURO|nr:hypothetical protein DSM5745_09816 [Aspergillus mulundensis]RDW64405.1 hypothetical protein DSM5745_09816 [Aspergillus mulundensis]